MVILSPGSLWGRIRSCFRDIISAAVEREVLLTCVSDEHHRRGSHWGGGAFSSPVQYRVRVESVPFYPL